MTDKAKITRYIRRFKHFTRGEVRDALNEVLEGIDELFAKQKKPLRRQRSSEDGKGFWPEVHDS